MVVLLVATLGLIVAAALAFWPAREDRGGTGESGLPGTGGHAPPSLPTSLEGVLAGQLVGGEISRSQYLRALEQIAARDEQRHPLDVPWDARP
ncbi:hypothetical protein QLQ12_15210 [Actinoplanes sp. NEAU-A12]|uniref:SHOCT domain-containing protein n=1 Tax=Actinoplanes sandaracinus TaxID=3045177 RepID=A0ABT6WJQ4_9ACTN|nr:hypothetical protein [Actinoplanes sandaracinus]MDI6099948.1 hypothetical protein [Actinoplanes sandaracinus]